MALPLLAPDAALFLDIDGTLIAFVPRPEDARVPPALLAIIAALQQALGGALAAVSGRALADVDRLFMPLKLAAAGQHGAEARMTSGGAAQILASPQAALAAVLAAVQPHLAARPTIRVEHKGLSTAFHYRGAEREGPALRAALAAAVAPHDDTLQLLDSHLCFDVRPRVANKGKVVERFMAAAPFVGRVPVFIGDDVTDEDGFAAVLALGGRAIRVGAERPTAATERLDSPAELRQWLERSATVLIG
ncbi:MAG TPA: trehalose-phosphatase [Stellaceae bacterium]|nr:trehalose-phosphatase [Stellaceae bacterium]